MHCSGSQTCVGQSAVSVDLTSIEYVLFSDGAIGLTPGASTYQSYGWQDDPGRPDYRTSAPKASYKEGEVVQTVLNAPGFANGRAVYWCLEGTGITGADVVSGSRLDSSVVNAETASASVQLSNDLLTEGVEQGRISFYSDSARTQLLASTSKYTIEDTSISTGDSSARDFANNTSTLGTLAVGNAENGCDAARIGCGPSMIFCAEPYRRALAR